MRHALKCMTQFLEEQKDSGIEEHVGHYLLTVQSKLDEHFHPKPITDAVQSEELESQSVDTSKEEQSQFYEVSKDEHVGNGEEGTGTSKKKKKLTPKKRKREETEVQQKPAKGGDASKYKAKKVKAKKKAEGKKTEKKPTKGTKK